MLGRIFNVLINFIDKIAPFCGFDSCCQKKWHVSHCNIHAKCMQCDNVCNSSNLNKKDKLVFLKKYSQIKNVMQSGKKINFDTFSMFVKSSELDTPQFAIMTSRKFGNSVKRNFAKRRIRHLIRIHFNTFEANKSYVFLPKKQILEVKFENLFIKQVKNS